MLRRPARPSASIWRSSSGVLRAINTARKLLAGPIQGYESEVKSQLPKYVVVITATDVTNSETEDIWLDDEEQPDEWESVAKNFTKVSLRRRRYPNSGSSSLCSPTESAHNDTLLTNIARLHAKSGSFLARGELDLGEGGRTDALTSSTL